MRLVELVAQKVEEWPNIEGFEAVCICQDNVLGNQLCAYNTKYVELDTDGEWRGLDKESSWNYNVVLRHKDLCDDWETAKVTKKMWEEERAKTVEEVKTFTKADLRTGMRVTRRNGSTCIVLLEAAHNYSSTKDFIINPIEGSHSWTGLDSYDQNLNYKKIPEHSIVKVEVPGHPYSIFYPCEGGWVTIWEREEPVKEVSMAEVEELFGCKVKIVD